MTATPLLDSLESTEALRGLEPAQLMQLAGELRSDLVDTVQASGGHLAAGLGVVELTIALHAVFDTPTDALVWDIGHQCYPHKILTGRREALRQVRRRGGLSGFLRRDESRYDAFGGGHSSTSISAALGMAIANAAQGKRTRTVAVIGDGGLTAGLAYEALNHAGSTSADLLVVFNDNGMSISPNVGALRGSMAQDPQSSRRFFELLGFSYAGPLDGHDLEALLPALRDQREKTGPRVLHVRTVKGKGYAPAEREPIRYHGVTPETFRGAPPKRTPTFTDAFGACAIELAERDPRVCVITPAMREGSGLCEFAARFPDRFFDVGIAEQHSVTLAAGLACGGMRPIVAIYSTFLQRALDQVIHDVALQKLPVIFALDRAGLVGPDGATHNGGHDIALLRGIPGMAVLSPADAGELRTLLYNALGQQGPVAIRYPRTAVAPEGLARGFEHVPWGLAQCRRVGRRIALLNFGSLLSAAMDVGECTDATVYDMRFVKPLDVRTLFRVAATHELVVTLEEGTAAGGAGSAVGECLAARGSEVSLLSLGLPDEQIEHGTRDECLNSAGLDRASILSAIARRVRMLDARGDESVHRARNTRPGRRHAEQIR